MMGTLARSDGSAPRAVSGHCRIGRTPASELVIEASYVSREHAVIQWAAGGWQVRDLGSRNGTEVDGRKLTPGVPRSITPASVLTFGDPTESWRLIDDSPPLPFATAADGRQVMAEDEVLAIPSLHDAELVVFPHGEEWLLESDKTTLKVAHDDDVVAAGTSWRLSLPFVPSPTEDNSDRALSNIDLRMSRDNGTVAVLVDDTPLPPRSWGQLLWILAERRLADVSAGDVAESEQGWAYADELADVLGVKRNGVNVHASRARRALAALGVLDAANLVERRVATGQLRLGTLRVQLAS